MIFHIDPITDVHYFDVTLQAEKQINIPKPASYSSFIYVFEGAVQLDDKIITEDNFAVFSDNTEVSFSSLEQSSRFIFVCGKPIGEPIVQKGPFVMNTNEEIHQAIIDYQNGVLVKSGG